MKTGIQIIPRLILLGTVITGVLVLLNYLLGHVPAPEQLWMNFLYTQAYTFCLYFANAMFFTFLDNRIADKFSAKRIGLGFAGSFAISLLVVFGLRVLQDVVLEGKSFEEFIGQETGANYLFAIAVTFIITLSLYAAGFYRAYQENRVKQQQIIAGRASAQLESLKNQIDPHFLFNSLNVLSALIEENPKQARKFTISLSKVYRYVLEQKDKELVSLSEELDFARTYMNLLKMRFEDGLEFELSGEVADERFKVVPLSLQLLLENAIKHNVVNAQNPLKIEVFADNGELVIRNNLQKKEVLSDRRGVGLENIASRYGLLTSRNVRIEESEGFFTVRIPLLTHQVEVESLASSEEELSYMAARKRMEELRSFYENLISFVVINLGLMILNLMTSSNYLWFLWVTGSWGLGLFFHAVKVFNIFPFFGREWEQRQIENYMQKNNNDNNQN